MCMMMEAKLRAMWTEDGGRSHIQETQWPWESRRGKRITLPRV